MDDREQFHVSRQFRFLAPWLSLIFLGAIAAFLFFVVLEMKETIKVWSVTALMLLPICWMCGRALYYWWYADKYTITVALEGIELHTPQHKDMRFLRSEIVEIKRPSFSFGRIDLRGLTENPVLRLETCFDGWPEILKFLEQTPALQKRCPLPAIFQFRILENFLRRVFYLAVFFFVISWAVSPSLDKPMIVMMFILQILLQLSSLESQIRGPRHLGVDTLGFSFRRGAIKGRENFADVTAISLRPTISGGELSELAVVATLPKGKELSLCPPTCDPFAVYRALRSGWELSRTK